MLNVLDIREADIVAVGCGARLSVLGDRNLVGISKEKCWRR